MNSQETLNKIMTLLNLSEEKQEVAVELATEKLDNGATLEAAAFEAGAEVFVVTEDAKVPAPVGEHTLEDGRVLVIVEEGIIDSIGEAQEEEAEESTPDQEPAEEEMAEEVALTEARVREIVQEMLGQYKEDMATEEEATEEPKEELSAEVKEEVKEEVELSVDEPAAEPIKHSPEAAAKEMIRMGKNAKGGTTASVFAKMANFNR